MKPRDRVTVVIVAATVVGVALWTFLRREPQDLYKVTILPSLGGRLTTATALNNRGQIVGYSETPDGVCHLCLWDGAGGVRDLGPCMRTRFYLNDAGQIAGMTMDPHGTQVAFLWDPARGLRTLGTLRGTCSGVRGLNNRGQVIGWWGDETHLQRPFVWDETTGMRELGMPDGDEGEAIAINDSGQIVGVLSRQAGGRPTLWTSNGPVPDAGPLLSLWNMLDINNHGYILGRQVSRNPDSFLVLYRQGGALTKLFPLDRSTNYPLLNDANQVLFAEFHRPWFERILRKRLGRPVGEYYLWDPRRGRVPLNLYVRMKKGERLDLFDLNNSGCIVGRIMGAGEASGRAVLLEPIPERWRKGRADDNRDPAGGDP